jgi:hypothetical protein
MKRRRRKKRKEEEERRRRMKESAKSGVLDNGDVCNLPPSFVPQEGLLQGHLL